MQFETTHARTKSQGRQIRRKASLCHGDLQRDDHSFWVGSVANARGTVVSVTMGGAPGKLSVGHADVLGHLDASGEGDDLIVAPVQCRR